MPPVEAIIALSILFVAGEVARPNPESLARRYPLAISLSFGLLHGFGFAAALGDAGLPRTEIAAALLFFNAGVEVGQLAFIAVALTLVAVILRGTRNAGIHAANVSQLEAISGYGLGIPAAFWFLDRLRAFWIP